MKNIVAVVLLTCCFGLGALGCAEVKTIETKAENDLVKLEALAYGAFVKAEAGLTWAVGHETEIKAGLTKIAATFPNDATVQKAVSKANAAIDAGDIDKAHTIVNSTIVVLTPTPGVAAITTATK